MSRSRRALRPAIGALVAGGVAVALSGCVVFAVPSPSQSSPGSPMVLNASLCASGSSGCTANGNSMIPATAFDNVTGQVMLGYRVPAGTVAPPSFLSAQSVLAFALSPSYAAELQRLAPAPPGQTWVGYISNTQQYAKAAPIQADLTSPSFELPTNADGSPFAPPFKVAQVVGSRTVNGAFGAGRPVSCGPSLTEIFDEDPDTPTAAFEICVDDSVPAPLTGDTSLPTRDFGILKAGASGSARQGTLASVPFTVRYAGTTTPLASLALSATTTLPGAVAAPNPGTLLPGSDSSTVVPVAIGIPSNAAPGTYDVTLTAKAVLGLSRVTTGKLVVTALPPAARAAAANAKPKLSLVLPKRFSASQARAKGMTLLIGSTKAIRAKVQLFQPRRKKALVSKFVRLRSPGPVTVKLKSAKLVKGPFRIVVTGTGFTVRARGRLLR